jgi:hypothetical protein
MECAECVCVGGGSESCSMIVGYYRVCVYYQVFCTLLFVYR